LNLFEGDFTGQPKRQVVDERYERPTVSPFRKQQDSLKKITEENKISLVEKKRVEVENK
jgi:hypothetical protein